MNAAKPRKRLLHVCVGSGFGFVQPLLDDSGASAAHYDAVVSAKHPPDRAPSNFSSIEGLLEATVLPTSLSEQPLGKA
jgi:hypothetical protein